MSPLEFRRIALAHDLLARTGAVPVDPARASANRCPAEATDGHETVPPPRPGESHKEIPPVWTFPPVMDSCPPSARWEDECGIDLGASSRASGAEKGQRPAA